MRPSLLPSLAYMGTCPQATIQGTRARCAGAAARARSAASHASIGAVGEPGSPM
jgi:hypothetical protein